MPSSYLTVLVCACALALSLLASALGPRPPRPVRLSPVAMTRISRGLTGVMLVAVAVAALTSPGGGFDLGACALLAYTVCFWLASAPDGDGGDEDDGGGDPSPGGDDGACDWSEFDRAREQWREPAPAGR